MAYLAGLGIRQRPSENLGRQIEPDVIRAHVHVEFNLNPGQRLMLCSVYISWHAPLLWECPHQQISVPLENSSQFCDWSCEIRGDDVCR